MFDGDSITMTAWAQQSKQAVIPAGTIDGSITPDLIPDIVACRLFFAALTENQPGAALESPRQRAKLRPIELANNDELALIAVAAGFRTDVAKIQGHSSAQGVSQTPLPSLNELAQHRLDLLQAQMTPDGFQRLLQHMRSEKKKMRMIPFPDMSEHSH